ncbi:hypothetical protein [Streptomyces sp. NBC_00996]|uniref:hypothetical protein n=1 Tax=Streptomyces sp. NBC_00996 TaxID=2903710 RepID=UPI00386FD53A|nr:hypothetical protein OG390_10190 [Streptomyces sp. NBC_00996]
MHDGTVELTGHYWAERDTDGQLHATLGYFTTWHAGPDRLTPCIRGGSRAFARPPATLLTDPGGRPAPLVSPFVPREGAAPGESGQLVQWREL